VKAAIELTRGKINEATELLYQGKKQEGCAKIDEVLVSLMGLNQQLALIRATGELYDYDGTALLTILTDVMKAIAEKDFVLVSDILQYDMLEELERLEQRL